MVNDTFHPQLLWPKGLLDDLTQEMVMEPRPSSYEEEPHPDDFLYIKKIRKCIAVSYITAVSRGRCFIAIVYKEFTY